MKLTTATRVLLLLLCALMHNAAEAKPPSSSSAGEMTLMEYMRMITRGNQRQRQQQPERDSSFDTMSNEIVVARSFRPNRKSRGKNNKKSGSVLTNRILSSSSVRGEAAASGSLRGASRGNTMKIDDRTFVVTPTNFGLGE